MKIALLLLLLATAPAATPGVTLTVHTGIALAWDHEEDGLAYRVTVNGTSVVVAERRVFLTEGILPTGNVATVTAIRDGVESAPSDPLVFDGRTYIRAEGSGGTLQRSPDLIEWTDAESPVWTVAPRQFFRVSD